jgi:hypothetical protein
MPSFILSFKNFRKILTSCWKVLCHWSSLPWSYAWLFSQHYWKWRHFRKILLWRIHCACEDYKNNFHAKITTYTVLCTTFKNRTRFSLQQLCFLKYHTVRTVPKSNRRIVDTKRNRYPPTDIYMIAQLYWFGTGTSIKSGGVKLILCSKNSWILYMEEFSVFKY